MKLLDEDHFPHLLVICGTILALAGLLANTVQKRDAQQIQINSQKEVERTRIEQDAKLARTKERLKVIPWAK